MCILAVFCGLGLPTRLSRGAKGLGLDSTHLSTSLRDAQSTSVDLRSRVWSFSCLGFNAVPLRLALSSVYSWLRMMEEQRYNVLVVGPTGVGKSALINTLIMKKRCAEGPGAELVTTALQREDVVLEGDGVRIRVCFYDTPGFTGRTSDAKMMELIPSAPSFDLCLICFNFIGNGSRYTPMVVWPFFEKFNIGSEALRGKSLIVLTKADLAARMEETSRLSALYAESDQYRQTTGGARKDVEDVDARMAALVLEWKRRHREDSGDYEGGCWGEIPIVPAGRAVFDEGGQFRILRFTEVAGFPNWIEELWSVMADLLWKSTNSGTMTGPRLAALSHDAVRKALPGVQHDQAEDQKRTGSVRSWCEFSNAYE